MECTQILIATFSLIFIFFFSFLYHHFSYNNSHQSSTTIPFNWPIFGMLPAIFSNLHHIADFATKILQESEGTLMAKVSWLSKMELLVTADPTNVHYVMSKRHEDFDKGANFKEIFEFLGDGVISSDSDKWKYQRKIALSSFTSTRFRRCMAETIKYKVESGLIPLLDRFQKEGRVVDLQDIFQRLVIDIIFMLLIGHDSNFVSLYPSSHFLLDFTRATEEVMLTRHILPDRIWKLQKRLGIGKESKHSKLAEAVDSFLYDFIKKKREEVMKRKKESPTMKMGDDLLSIYIEENYGTQDHRFKSPDIFLRDTFMNFMLAGQDSTKASLAWFFWLLSTRPQVEAKIIEELTNQNFNERCDVVSQLGDPNKMVYLHATIYEALRLYPPVPFVQRFPNKTETLPSGHEVKPWTMIILCVYAMGRMKWVWGEDCEEFKPERWITEQGTIKHEPSHKFFAFGSGPRVCLGKEVFMVQMKAVVCALLRRGYQFEVVEGHRVEPASSVVIRMKNGLKVKVTRHVP